ncbi:tripeptide aminopeptidase [Acetitomaculum ruminis DSM 5522]|uniref:Peptidase T n=1 Tax=Acetitomaculum ruminis DSM 5522 TaxID=1120918 RepID=A0A1I0ZWP5_9FIRM|nr:peptidase T [Acetitomaculum ruminis]SFB30149.1 tripeptide aminopeptidase [Acetitomaculum ruminis DSM 5522]
MIKNKKLIERFLKYVSIDTQSDEDSESSPTTKKQFDLANILAEELKELGLEVSMDTKHCYVYGYLEKRGDISNNNALGFIAHMDTSPEASGKNVKTRIIENYQGKDELLSEKEFPELLNHIGEDLIATDGNTLLGADDKAGIAEIMTALEYLKENEEIPHRPLAICFTPDEETGRGTDYFDEEKFKARQAYTVDGGKLGILEYECFNAAGVKVFFKGNNVHTGSAKNVMINAILLANEFINMLPANERPEHTEGYEGFYHVGEIKGDVTDLTMKMLIRDHDKETFEKRKEYLMEVAGFLNKKYAKEVVELEIKDQYKNMREVLESHMELIDNAMDILKELGVNGKTMPIRGGTDGANLSFRGIPCPNLCTGGYNYHSVNEYASIQEMEITTELLIKLTGR